MSDQLDGQCLTTMGQPSTPQPPPQPRKPTSPAPVASLIQPGYTDLGPPPPRPLRAPVYPLSSRPFLDQDMSNPPRLRTRSPQRPRTSRPDRPSHGTTQLGIPTAPSAPAVSALGPREPPPLDVPLPPGPSLYPQVPTPNPTVRPLSVPAECHLPRSRVHHASLQPGQSAYCQRCARVRQCVIGLAGGRSLCTDCLRQHFIDRLG
ncbi:hypothetical protein J7T55_002789 [Diaporthe amygdali]|uniref:uncharacterized protein n=1 Tax=Phomopsis amygdali TaxID=1214568 RepID=UPI0022FEEA71|nr:uncharacterized protein J7T55_002789 [Diaporthe amygdali]KAJ0122277.1 hypothetical protein J7T55_002789 [Diaporthe amygdali]